MSHKNGHIIKGNNKLRSCPVCNKTEYINQNELPEPGIRQYKTDTIENVIYRYFECRICKYRWVTEETYLREVIAENKQTNLFEHGNR